MFHSKSDHFECWFASESPCWLDLASVQDVSKASINKHIKAASKGITERRRRDESELGIQKVQRSLWRSQRGFQRTGGVLSPRKRECERSRNSYRTSSSKTALELDVKMEKEGKEREVSVAGI